MTYDDALAAMFRGHKVKRRGQPWFLHYHHGDGVVMISVQGVNSVWLDSDQAPHITAKDWEILT